MTGPRVALDWLPDAVVVVDHDGRVVAANAHAERLLGVGPDEVGRPFAEAVAWRDAAGQPCRLPLAAPTRATTDLVEGGMAVGVRRSAESELVAVQAGGLERRVAVVVGWHPDGVVVSARSAGSRHARQRAMSETVAMMSHELRSPLTSVKGFTRTLLQRWDRFSDEQKRVMLATIDHDADRVTQLLHDLLELSRIDSGRLTLRRSWLDLGELASRTLDRVGQRGQPIRSRLVLDVEPGLPRVHGDAERLDTLLTNLVDNALREAPEGPVVVTVGGSVTTDGPVIEVTVRDHGPGVAADRAGEIFRRSWGRRRGAGSGLGLSIGRGVAVAHGGSLTLDPPTDAQGACFRLRLPAGG